MNVIQVRNSKNLFYYILPIKAYLKTAHSNAIE